jgi:hypothetical protein
MGWAPSSPSLSSTFFLFSRRRFIPFTPYPPSGLTTVTSSPTNLRSTAHQRRMKRPARRAWSMASTSVAFRRLVCCWLSCSSRGFFQLGFQVAWLRFLHFPTCAFPEAPTSVRGRVRFRSQSWTAYLSLSPRGWPAIVWPALRPP